MKLAIKAELAYSFAPSTQVIANVEASQSSDQTILSESLDIQPQVQVLSDTTPHFLPQPVAAIPPETNVGPQPPAA